MCNIQIYFFITMDHFRTFTENGIHANRSVFYLLCIVNRNIRKKIKDTTITFKGIKYTPYILKLIRAYIPELYKINNINPYNWGYDLRQPLRCWGGEYDDFGNAVKPITFDQFNSNIIDYSEYFDNMDIISIPLVCNTIKANSGIYKMTCVCDPNVTLLLGLTHENNFDTGIYTHTYDRCFWPQDITDLEDMVCLSNSGEYYININDSKTKETIQKKNKTVPTSMSLVYDSYQYNVYLYHDNICMKELEFEQMDDYMVPFIYIYYDRTYSKSDCLVSIKNKSIQFI